MVVVPEPPQAASDRTMHIANSAVRSFFIFNSPFSIVQIAGAATGILYKFTALIIIIIIYSANHRLNSTGCRKIVRTIASLYHSCFFGEMAECGPSPGSLVFRLFLRKTASSQATRKGRGDPPWRSPRLLILCWRCRLYSVGLSVTKGFTESPITWGYLPSHFCTRCSSMYSGLCWSCFWMASMA